MKLFFAFRGEWTNRCSIEQASIFFDEDEFRHFRNLCGEDPNHRFVTLEIPTSSSVRIMFGTITTIEKRSKGRVTRLASDLLTQLLKELLK